jgi:hypothetical protein
LAIIAWAHRVWQSGAFGVIDHSPEVLGVRTASQSVLHVLELCKGLDHNRDIRIVRHSLRPGVQEKFWDKRADDAECDAEFA